MRREEKRVLYIYGLFLALQVIRTVAATALAPASTQQLNNRSKVGKKYNHNAKRPVESDR